MEVEEAEEAGGCERFDDMLDHLQMWGMRGEMRGHVTGSAERFDDMLDHVGVRVALEH